MNNQLIEQLKTKLQNIEPSLIWIMSLWFAYKLIHNGIRKFDPDGFWTSAFENWGYPVWFRILIGVLETVGGILLIVPRTRIYGGLTLCVVMLGALGTRLINGTGWEDAMYLLFVAASCLFLAGYSKENVTV